MTPNTPATNPQADLAVAAARADDRREIERLRAELVAARDRYGRECDEKVLAEMRLERAERRIAAVRELHTVHSHRGGATCDPWGCTRGGQCECGSWFYPCPTIRALDPQTPTSGPESPAGGLAGSNACSDTPEGGEGL